MEAGDGVGGGDSRRRGGREGGDDEIRLEAEECGIYRE